MLLIDPWTTAKLLLAAWAATGVVYAVTAHHRGNRLLSADDSALCASCRVFRDELAGRRRRAPGPLALTFLALELVSGWPLAHNSGTEIVGRCCPALTKTKEST